MRSLHVAIAFTLGGAVAAAGLVMTACASTPDVNRTTGIITPDYATYQTYVDAYLTRRCGSLDCHGQPGRAYRIYSREGFRLYTVQDGGLVSGQQPTTPEEQLANFQALVSIEPEEMTRLMARQGDNPNTIIFLRKPLKLERHKGGPAMAEDDPGYRCVVAWLQIPVVNPDGTFIPPAMRTKLSQNAIRNCQTATDFP